jgi:hypothetical protein
MAKPSLFVLYYFVVLYYLMAVFPYEPGQPENG